MDPNTTRSSLLSRIRNSSDAAAWREFDEKYGDLIVRYCQRRGLQINDAEDIRQIVMMRLARVLRTFEYNRSRGRFRDYLGRTVQHVIINHMACPKRPVAAVDQDILDQFPEPGTVAADDPWEQEWLTHHFRMALEGLRQSHQPRTVELFVQLLSGKSVQQAAAEYGLSVSAAQKTKERLLSETRELVLAQIRAEDEPDG